MTETTLTTQLKQLLKRGYSEMDVRNLALAPKNIVDQAIAEFHAEERIHEKTIQIQHNQANFAMRLGN